jgi:hypothetical protein
VVEYPVIDTGQLPAQKQVAPPIRFVIESIRSDTKRGLSIASVVEGWHVD